MSDRERRSAVEVLIGKPRAWVVWAWSALAIAWIFIAVVEASGFRTFLAIAWSVLAMSQIVAFYLDRRRRLIEAKDIQTNAPLPAEVPSSARIRSVEQRR